MIGNERNVRDSARRRAEQKRAELRRKKRMISWLVLFGMGTAILLLTLYIRDVKQQLKAVRTALHRIEVLQQEEDGSVAEVAKEADTVSSVGTVNVEKPVQYSKEEVLQRLNELGKTNPTIEEVGQNSSLYPENLLLALANNPEMADFAGGYLNPDKLASRLTEAEKEQSFPLLLQWDPRWGYQTYGGGSNIGLAGCGPTCMSMVLYYLTGNEKLTPDKIAAYAMENGYYVEGTGTAWALMEDIPKLYDVGVTNLQIAEKELWAALEKDNILICALSKGDFTLAGHFIVIYGYDAEGFLVNDPNSVARSKKRWTFDAIEKQIKSIWAYKAGAEQDSGSGLNSWSAGSTGATRSTGATGAQTGVVSTTDTGYGIFDTGYGILKKEKE